MARILAFLLVLTLLPMQAMAADTVIEPVYEIPANVQLLLQVADE